MARHAAARRRRLLCGQLAGLLAARRPASLWPRAQCCVRGVRCIEAFIAPAFAAAESIEDVGRTMGMLTALLLVPLGSWRDHFFLAGGDGTGFKRTGDASTEGGVHLPPAATPCCHQPPSEHILCPSEHELGPRLAPALPSATAGAAGASAAQYQYKIWRTSYRFGRHSCVWLWPTTYHKAVAGTHL